MTAPVDYYALLGIPRKASPEEVRAAYKLQQRIWRKRAAATADESVSGEAARRLAQLDEAFNVLSDQQRRATYDRQPPPPTIVEPASTSLPAEAQSGDLIEQAQAYLEAGDYYSASHAAREATNAMGTSAESWLVLSRASAGLRRMDEAVYEARRAIELNPENAECHFNLGIILEELGQWDSALAEYQQAAERNSDEPLYQLAIGGVWLQRNQPDKALPIIERVYTSARDNEAACYYYAQAVIAAAEAVPRDNSKDGYAVTSALEIQRMREYLSRTASIRHLDKETRQTIRDTEAYLQRMEGYTFHVPFVARSGLISIYSIAGSSDGGVGTEILLLFLAGLIAVGIALAPLWLVIGGFSAMGSGSIGGGFLLLLIGAGLGYIWYRLIWVPRWKVNARMRDHRVRYHS